MEVRAAQEEMAQVFRGGVVGQAVSGVIWLVSAVLGTWISQGAAVATLMLGGILIFPLTQVVLRLLGGPAGPRKGNPLNGLAMQIAFIVPLLLPVVLWLIGVKINLFYPAMLMVVGAHYLPFIFLYGMPHFGVLAAVLLAGGAALGWLLPGSFSAGGWLGGAALLGYSLVVGLMRTRR